MSVGESVVGNLVAMLTLNTLGFTQGIDAVQKKLNLIGGALTGVGVVTTKVTKSAVKSATDFETAFTGVTKTVDAPKGANDEEFFGNLRQEILDMSEELPTAATEIAGVYQAAGQLGISAENLTGFSRAMIQMASATNLTSEGAATTLARFANITQMDQTEFENLGSSIVHLGNNMATTESEIAEYSQRLALMGKLLGMSEADVVAYGATLSSLGLESASSATALVRFTSQVTQAVAGFTGTSSEDLEMFAKITTMTKQQIEELSEATGLSVDELKSLGENYADNATTLKKFAEVSGMTEEQFAQAWSEDATGAMQSFLDTFGKMTNEEQLQFFEDLEINQINERLTVQSLASASELLGDAVEMSNTAWDENNALVNEADKANSTTAAQLQLLNNNITELGISLGTNLLPVINDIVDALKPVVEDIANWISEHPKLTQGIVAVGLALGLVGSIMTALTPIIIAFNAGMLTISAPVLAVAGAIVGLIAVLALLYPSLDEIGNKASETADQIAQMDTSTQKIVENGIGELSVVDRDDYAWVSGVFDPIKMEYTEGWAYLDDLTGEYVLVSEDMVNAVTSTTETLTEQAEAMSTVSESVEGSKSTAEQAQEIFQNMQDAFNGMTESTTMNTDEMESSLSTINDLLESERFKELAENPVDETVLTSWETFNTALSTATGNLESAETTISDGVLSGCLDSIASSALSAADAFIMLSDGISSALSSYNEFSATGGTGAGSRTDLFRASGGYVQSGHPYIVGEEGAELFVPRSSGTIIPNDYLQEHSQPITVNVGTVYGESYLRDYVVDTMTEAILKEMRLGA